MSADPTGRREIAHRLFAVEYRDATHAFRESDEDRAPKYVVSPTGVQVNRLFVVGVLTEAAWVNEDTIRARIVDPTGAFIVYASQYQPDARARLSELDPPAFVAVTGKAHTFRPDGSDRIYSSIRPEAVGVVDASTRDRWVVSTAKFSLERLGRMAAAIERDTTGTGGIPIALTQYEPTPAYLSRLAEVCIDVLRLVTGEIESVEVGHLDLHDPDPPTMSMADLVELGRRMADDNGERRIDEPPESEEKKAAEIDPDTPTVTAPSEDTKDGLQRREPDEPVLTGEERASIEEEFGTDFTTGAAVEPTSDVASEQDTESSPEQADAVESDEPDDRLVELLTSMDDGSGVERASLFDVASERFEFDEQTFDEALRTALMDGRCYEASADVFRPI